VEAFINKVLSLEGTGWLFVVIEFLIIVYLDKRVKECGAEVRKNGTEATVALKSAADAMDGVAQEARGLAATIKELGTLITLQSRTIELSDERARERAEHIMHEVRGGRR